MNKKVKRKFFHIKIILRKPNVFQADILFIYFILLFQGITCGGESLRGLGLWILRGKEVKRHLRGREKVSLCGFGSL
jgi:hypothetical protein